MKYTEKYKKILNEVKKVYGEGIPGPKLNLEDYNSLSKLVKKYKGIVDYDHPKGRITLLEPTKTKSVFDSLNRNVSVVLSGGEFSIEIVGQRFIDRDEASEYLKELNEAIKVLNEIRKISDELVGE